MECDAAGANIYHIIVCRNTFHSFFFLTFFFQLYVYIGGVRPVAIKIDQVCAENKLTQFLQRSWFKIKGKSSLKKLIVII